MAPREWKVLIIDGYNDEPGGLGVPPYIDVYPRYIAGSFWLANKHSRIDYVTVDAFRSSLRAWLKRATKYDVVVFIAGVVVPGKYIGGKPAEPRELIEWARILSPSVSNLILVGPAAKWGMGIQGGLPAYHPSEFKKAGFHILVTGDVEEFFHDFALHGPEKAQPWRTRKDYSLVNKVAVLGARIIRMHPNYGRNLIVEIETYRGCARWVSGGCSFCVEPLRGRPIQRDPWAIIEEVKALYNVGARNFRLGRQADILIYGSKEIGEDEWPKPNPDALEKLFKGIRAVAPNLEVLHIDNVNPGTISRHVDESLKALKIIIKYHTPGDVAAMGLETADPKVAKINNLNTTPEEAFRAIEIVNKVGTIRGHNGLPHLLPGLNFILGLPGETAETYHYNKAFLEEILNKGYLIRRVNIRRLLPLPSTRIWRMKYGVHKRLEAKARSFIKWVREVFDVKMLQRVVPPGTRLRDLWVEACINGLCYARQPGSYPLTVTLRGKLPRGILVREVVVVSVRSGRSVEAKIEGEYELEG